MFKWLNQQIGKRKPEEKKQKTQKIRQLWGREFNIVKKGLDEKQIVRLVDDLIAQHKASQQASSASLRSLLKTAVTDAEQMAANIKMKAQAEAEAEAATIITQAKQETQEIKRKAEIAAQKEVEDTVSMANRKAEITEIEAKQKALLFLLRAKEEVEKEIREDYKQAYSRLASSLQDLVSEGQNIEVELKSKRAALWQSKTFELKEHEAALLSSAGVTAPPVETSTPTETEVKADMATEEKLEQPIQLQEEAPEEKIEQPTQLQEEAPEEKIEQPTQLQEEAAVSEPVEAVTEELLEQNLLEERAGREETESALLGQDSQTLYTGEVELAIPTPVDPKMVSKLYNQLQAIPELRILYTRGSWDRGTTITVVLDKPASLISIISKIPGVEATPELPEKESLLKGTSSSLLGTKRKGAKRIKLALKEA